MTFAPDQVAALSAKLDPAAVKTRTQAGRNLSYIEGWKAIDEANRIFGFGSWDRTLISIQLLGEPRLVDGKSRVGYMATVRITVRAGDTLVVRDGTGFGSGIDKDVDQAHESALKEAETDAMKRALMTFGNPFGLALYDKTQENVGTPAPARPSISQRAAATAPAPVAEDASPLDTKIADTLVKAIEMAQTLHDLERWRTENRDAVNDLERNSKRRVMAVYDGMKAALEQPELLRAG